MDDSVELIDLFSGVATSRDSNAYKYTMALVNCLVGALPHTMVHSIRIIRDTIIPLVRS